MIKRVFWRLPLLLVVRLGVFVLAFVYEGIIHRPSSFGPALIGPAGTDGARGRQMIVASTPLCFAEEEVIDRKAKLPSPCVNPYIFKKKSKSSTRIGCQAPFFPCWSFFLTSESFTGFRRRNYFIVFSLNTQ
jgi:hypothetical protein